MEVERREGIVALLDVRFEGLPLGGRVALSGSGFVHRVRVAVSCEDCLANGRVLWGCVSCGGRGVVEVWRGRDPYASEAVLPFGFDPGRHDGERERDRQIVVLGEQVLGPRSEADLLVEANGRPFGWEVVRRGLYARFDLAVLERAVALLHSCLPGVGAYSERGLAFLDSRLPVPLRAPLGGRGFSGLVGRDVAIRRAVGSGRPVVRVAADFGLSVSQVNRVVAAGGPG